MKDKSTGPATEKSGVSELNPWPSYIQVPILYLAKLVYINKKGLDIQFCFLGIRDR